MSAPDDLAPVLAPPPGVEVEFVQGTVVAWDPATGANQVKLGGTTLPNLKIWNSTEGFSLSAGDVVGILRLGTQYVILGRIVAPNDPAREDIRLVVYSDTGLIIRGGGGVIVEDGGSVEAQYPDGKPAAYFGSTVDSNNPGGPTTGHGLVIFDDDAQPQTDIFYAIRQSGGSSLIGGAAEDIGLNSSGQAALAAGTDAFLTAGGQMLVQGNTVFLQSDANTYVSVDPAGINLQSGGPTYVNVGNSTFRANSSNLVYLHAGGQLQLDSDLGEVFITHDNVRSDVGANVHWSLNGLLQRVTSAARYKTGVADADLDPAAVLALRPRTWTDRDSGGAGVGLIAEEVAEAGLSRFVTYTDDGAADSVTYDRLPVALVALAKRQQNRIDELAARLESLERKDTWNGCDE